MSREELKNVGAAQKKAVPALSVPEKFECVTAEVPSTPPPNSRKVTGISPDMLYATLTADRIDEYGYVEKINPAGLFGAQSAVGVEQTQTAQSAINESDKTTVIPRQ